MAAAAITHKCHHCPEGSHCAEKEKPDIVMDIVEAVCVVALAVIACYMNWKIFVPYFAVGTGIGVYGFYKNEQAAKTRSASCSQGFIEGMTGVRLPRPVSVAVNMGLAIEHMMHHFDVLIPATALMTGAAFGYYSGVCYRKIRDAF